MKSLLSVALRTDENDLLASSSSVFLSPVNPFSCLLLCTLLSTALATEDFVEEGIDWNISTLLSFNFCLLEGVVEGGPPIKRIWMRVVRICNLIRQEFLVQRKLHQEADYENKRRCHCDLQTFLCPLLSRIRTIRRETEKWQQDEMSGMNIFRKTRKDAFW